MASEQTPQPAHPRLRRTGLALLTVVIALAAVVALLLVLQSRDRSQLHDSSAAADAPGQAVPAGQMPAGVPGAAGARPGDAQILAWTERGNVVLLYGTRTPPPALTALARTVAGPPDPALAATGQAVVLARRAGVDGVVALAWRRAERAPRPGDPALEEFATYWLGRGAGG